MKESFSFDGGRVMSCLTVCIVSSVSTSTYGIKVFEISPEAPRPKVVGSDFHHRDIKPECNY